MFPALGELKAYNAILGNLRPTFPVSKNDGKTETIPKDTHDQIIIHGFLESRVMLSYHMRGGPPFKDSPGFLWRIYN